MQYQKILVVDDEESIRYMLKMALEEAGYEVELASDGITALAKLTESVFDCVISDVRMPEMSGLELLKAIQEVRPDLTVIVMSAFGSLDTAIEAMKLGAYDYVSKPFKQDEILLTLKKAEERERLRKENLLLRREVEKKYSFDNIIGKSTKMQEIFRRIEKIAEYKSTVLITGESGTGKELVAKAIHYSSPRRDLPFIAVNCGAIPGELLESELFGHVKGAFTGAIAAKKGLFTEADKGTIFLDEIGDLPLNLQVKLLRVLQEGEIRRVGDTRTFQVDVRVIAATAKDLLEEVQKGNFREDLYYRLNVVPFYLPPLRERREDIPLLVWHFLRKYSAETGKEIKEITPDAMNALVAYEWKGNVRELENVIERAVVMSEGQIITTEYLPEGLVKSASDIILKIPESRISIKTTVKELVEMAEKELIARALAKTGNNRTRAAELLEISHRALMYKLKEYHL
ncbi:MAG TPA: sigma-54 dependent transcriptional regulator [Candidatus Limnocylindrales bacterium]|nr:sigma-54 dependent transcriptional regulator [Candidatus Limnocylindrales bacterium]